jgi:hypothetical protein
MTPVRQLRYSITFRTILDKLNKSSDPRHSPEQIAQRLTALQAPLESTTNDSERAAQLKIAL